MTTAGKYVFSVAAINWKSIAGLLAFIAAVFVTVVVGLNESPGTGAILASAAVFVLLLFLLAATKVVMTHDRLVVGGGFYKVKVPWDRIDADRVHRLDPNDAFRLGWRKNGVGWPGCCLGWFSSNAGKNVFAAISGRKNLVYIPTHEDFDIVVTPVDPEAFIESARRHSRAFVRSA